MQLEKSFRCALTDGFVQTEIARTGLSLKSPQFKPVRSDKRVTLTHVS
jgi:hypothetical protein